MQRRHILKALPLLGTALASVLVIPPVQAYSDTLQVSRTLMGTRVDLSLQGGSHQARLAAAQAAWIEMTRLEQMMSRYTGTSVVNAVNLLAGISPVVVPTEMMQVLRAAKTMAAISNGAFDVTVGSLKDWDFDPSHPAIPGKRELASQLPLVNHHDLVLDDKLDTAFLRRRGMRLDLGGIAKLPILQAGMRAIMANGIDNIMINGGGDVMVHGSLHGTPWRIGLRDPRVPDQLQGTISLHQGIVAASGDYERCFIVDGHKYHHILDPKTGYPSQGLHGLALVSSDLSKVNGLGAAIMVEGLSRGKGYLKKLPGVDAMMVDAGGEVWLSNGMRQRLNVTG